MPFLHRWNEASVDCMKEMGRKIFLCSYLLHIELAAKVKIKGDVSIEFQNVQSEQILV